MVVVDAQPNKQSNVNINIDKNADNLIFLNFLPLRLIKIGYTENLLLSNFIISYYMFVNKKFNILRKMQAKGMQNDFFENYVFSLDFNI